MSALEEVRAIIPSPALCRCRVQCRHLTGRFNSLRSLRNCPLELMLPTGLPNPNRPTRSVAALFRIWHNAATLLVGPGLSPTSILPP